MRSARLVSAARNSARLLTFSRVVATRVAGRALCSMPSAVMDMVRLLWQQIQTWQ